MKKVTVPVITMIALSALLSGCATSDDTPAPKPSTSVNVEKPAEPGKFEPVAQPEGWTTSGVVYPDMEFETATVDELGQSAFAPVANLDAAKKWVEDMKAAGWSATSEVDDEGYYFVSLAKDSQYATAEVNSTMLIGDEIVPTTSFTVTPVDEEALPE